MTYQQTIIIGRLGKSPEMRYTPNGKAVTNFSVAVNRVYTSASGERIEDVTWFKVTCWGKMAETTNDHLQKGRQVMVVGRVKADAYTGQDGNPRATLELTAQEVKFLGGRGDQNGGQSGEDFADVRPYKDEEEIPF
jgi:single-strand DNA-binding protein